jgi:hypothetical protein
MYQLVYNGMAGVQKCCDKFLAYLNVGIVVHQWCIMYGVSA